MSCLISFHFIKLLPFLFKTNYVWGSPGNLFCIVVELNKIKNAFAIFPLRYFRLLGLILVRTLQFSELKNYVFDSEL